MPETTTPTSSKPTLKSTVEQAKNWLRERLRKGERCPVCGQRAQMYRRKVTASMVNTLGKVAVRGRSAVGGWVYLPDVPQHSRDFSTVAYFGLAEQRPERRADGGKAGWWRVTENGEKFLRGNLTIQKYALVFDGRRYHFEGDPMKVGDVAPEFRYDELLAGV